MLGVLVSYIGSQTSAHAREKTFGTQGTGHFEVFQVIKLTYACLGSSVMVANIDNQFFGIKLQLWRCEVKLMSFYQKWCYGCNYFSVDHISTACVLVTFRVQSRCKHFMIDQTRSGKFVIVGMPRVYKSLKEMVDVHKKVWLCLHLVCITERKNIPVNKCHDNLLRFWRSGRDRFFIEFLEGKQPDTDYYCGDYFKNLTFVSCSPFPCLILC